MFHSQLIFAVCLWCLAGQTATGQRFDPNSFNRDSNPSLLPDNILAVIIVVPSLIFACCICTPVCCMLCCLLGDCSKSSIDDQGESQPQATTTGGVSTQADPEPSSDPSTNQNSSQPNQFSLQPVGAYPYPPPASSHPPHTETSPPRYLSTSTPDQSPASASEGKDKELTTGEPPSYNEAADFPSALALPPQIAIDSTRPLLVTSV